MRTGTEQSRARMAIDRAHLRVGSGVATLLVIAGVVALPLPAHAAATWAIEAHPRPPAPRTGVFNAVACFAATNCTAVGDFDNATAARTLIEHWDGSSWTLQTSRNVGTAVE